MPRKKKDPRGGSRPNAGRKAKVDALKEQIQISITTEEKQKWDQLPQKMKEQLRTQLRKDIMMNSKVQAVLNSRKNGDQELYYNPNIEEIFWAIPEYDSDDTINETVVFTHNDDKQAEENITEFLKVNSHVTLGL